MLIAARLSSDILAEVSEGLILAAWSKALQVLEDYSHFGASIKRLTTTLRLLYEAVPQQYSHFQENSRQCQTDSTSTFRNPAESTTAVPYPLDFSAANAKEASGSHVQDENNSSLDDAFLDLDTIFVPNDLSWLMTIPLDS